MDTLCKEDTVSKWHISLAFLYLNFLLILLISYSSANINCDTATRSFQLIGLAVSWSVIQYIKVNVKVGFTSLGCGFCSSSAKWQRQLHLISYLTVIVLKYCCYYIFQARRFIYFLHIVNTWRECPVATKPIIRHTQ